MRYSAVMTLPPRVAPIEMTTPDVNQSYTHDFWIASLLLIWI